MSDKKQVSEDMFKLDEHEAGIYVASVKQASPSGEDFFVVTDREKLVEKLKKAKREKETVT